MLARHIFLLTAALTLTLTHAGTVSSLAARGYTVLPYPQQVELEPSDFELGSGWGIELSSGVPSDSVAVSTLREEMHQRFLAPLDGGAKQIRLELSPGSVAPGTSQDRNREVIASQAYRLELRPTGIRIVANAGPGLLYGVETLVQLVKRAHGKLWLPAANITDWPDLQLRNIYWDDAHHLDHMDVLKAAIRQAAFFKANGFAIKLEGHFQYEHAPAIVEPHALTPGQLQELTDYGLRYYVQVIPYLDGPAHVAFVLKHPEYAKLRAFPDSNYEMCATNPDTYKLLEGMFADLLAANRGVHYFILSTDEAYYIGLADNPQCNEVARARQLGGVGGMLAEFVTKAAGYLHDHGREVIFWGEYPLKTPDIARLPPWMINGETYGPEFDTAYRSHGIRQMIYTSIEGEEKMFPNYFVLPRTSRLHPDREVQERVPAAVQTVAGNPARKTSDLIGMLVAGWADMGLHPETFWLGYATISAAGWNPSAPVPDERISAFYPLFYGDTVRSMNTVYQLMSLQGQIWNDTWDTTNSTARKPIWGNSDHIFKPPVPAHDQTLALPPSPSGQNLAYAGDWSKDNSQRLQEADSATAASDELHGLLRENLRLASRNRYNLEVFLAIAGLYRQNLDFIGDLSNVDRALADAAAQAGRGKAKDAVSAVDRALNTAEQMRQNRNRALSAATEVWYRSWLPRVAEANGRRFVHELDDVKDHLPDRTVDMSYLVYREMLLPMNDWYTRVQNARNQYARSHNLPERTGALDWSSLD